MDRINEDFDDFFHVKIDTAGSPAINYLWRCAVKSQTSKECCVVVEPPHFEKQSFSQYFSRCW